VSIEFVEIGPARLEVLRIEPQRAGATLVFLHEGLGSLAAWRDFPRHVCERLQLPGLLYSRRGYGASTRLDAPRGANYLHREAWEVLPALLAHLRIERPLLVGHSDGGSIALLFAARHEPCAIAVMAAHVFVEEITLGGLRAARAAWDAGKLGAGLARLHADPEGAFLGWNDGWLAPAFRDWNIEAELPRVRCPVLAIQGSEDQYGTVAQLEAIAAGVSGDSELLMLENCGHAPQRDQPEAVIAAVERLARAVAALPAAPG
jgi:pimeloyl-ACP methyl ester carboxylesterase